jgi:hypothetical protein
MRILDCKYKAGVVGLFFGTLVSAQTLVQPGQVSNSSQSWSPAAMVSSPRLASGQGGIASPEGSHDQNMRRIWIGSLLAAASASAFDAGTSWGEREGNGFLTSNNGTFGAWGLSFKVAVAAAVIVPQVVLRRHKELRMRFAIGNFVEAGLFTAVSAHNIQVRQSK